jgi:predicted PurR-regulated permease PerM
MKKSIFCLTVILLLSVFPSTVIASEKSPVPINNATTEIPAEIKTLLNRLDEIKTMDKSNLKSFERKELRKELREIKKEIKSKGGGLYLSASAIIIILLILLIL